MKNTKKAVVVVIALVVLVSLNVTSKKKGLSNYNPKIGLGVQAAPKDSLTKISSMHSLPTTWAVMVMHAIGLHDMAWDIEMGTLYVAKSNAQKRMEAQKKMEACLD